MALLSLRLSAPNSYPRPAPPVLSPHTPWLSMSQGYLTLTLTLTLTRGYLSPLHGSPHPKAFTPAILAPRPQCSRPRPRGSPCPKAKPNPNPNPRISIPIPMLSPPRGSLYPIAILTTRLSTPHGSPSTPNSYPRPRPRCSHPTPRGSPCPRAT